MVPLAGGQAGSLRAERPETPAGVPAPDSPSPEKPSPEKPAGSDLPVKAGDAATKTPAASDRWSALLRRANCEVRRDVEFARMDGKPLLADLYQPPATSSTPANTEPSPAAGPAKPAEEPAAQPAAQPAAGELSATGQRDRRPAVLMIHGGAWMAGNKAQVAWHAGRLAERGYVVMAIDYRLAPQHPFPAQRDDCRAALQWLYQRADELGVDAQRVAAYGYSAGGHLTCLLAFQEAADQHAPDKSPRLRAIVAGGVPCGFETLPLDSWRLAFWLGGTRRQRGDVYREACPLSFVSGQCPPAFLFHGDGDLIVPSGDSERLHERLRDCGVDAQWHLVADAGHLAAYLDEDTFQRSAEFLDRHLQTTHPE
jgi:triacylglycerol lipase